MNKEQQAALGEYVDVRRGDGAGYDTIAAQLAERGLRLTPAEAESAHRRWKRAEWRAERRRHAVEVELTEGTASTAAAEEECLPAAAEGAKEECLPAAAEGAETDVVRYLAQRLITAKVGRGRAEWKYLYTRALKPGQTCRNVKGRGEAGGVTWLFRAVIFETGGRVDHVEPEARIRGPLRASMPSEAQKGRKTDAVRVEKLQFTAEAGRGAEWKYLYTRALKPGQTCRNVKGRGEAGGVTWLFRAVIFETGGRVDHVEPEARIRQRIRGAAAAKLGLKSEAVRVEKLQITGERLNLEEVAAQQAAMLQLFLGRKSNIRSGAHLGRLTGRTRAAVSHRKLKIAEKYYGETGGKAGFEGTPGARKHREKVERENLRPDGRANQKGRTHSPG